MSIGEGNRFETTECSTFFMSILEETSQKWLMVKEMS